MRLTGLDGAPHLAFAGLMDYEVARHVMGNSLSLCMSVYLTCDVTSVIQ